MSNAGESVLEADGIRVVLDLAVGHIRALEIEAGGRTILPLHRAPWAYAPDELPDGIAPGLARLSGDFFCAPFSANDIDPAPTHGWPANSGWSVVSVERQHGVTLGRYRLDRAVMGATVEKVLRLVDRHPFLYQEHRLIGGSGLLPVAHHAMTRMASGGRLAFSPKRAALVPAAAIEAGSVLASGGLLHDIAAVPLAAGGSADLGAFPLAARHEDFAVLVEADHPGPGWTVVSRRREGDAVVVLKDPRVLPVTMLWYSHGGRDHAPWNGRHVGVLGVEDGCTAVGHRRSIGDNDLSAMGVATALRLEPGQMTVIRQAIGVTLLEGTASGVELMPGGLRLRMEDGGAVDLAHDDTFVMSAR